MQQENNNKHRLGVVSFLNATPLVAGLGNHSEVSLRYRVPADLPRLLHENLVDAALVPVVDFGRSAGQWVQVSDACIASAAETLTVRVFSRVPLDEVRSLQVDEDSHTSVVLADLLWRKYFNQPLTLVPGLRQGRRRDCEAALLIGDKVITDRPAGHPHQIDLGQAWRSWTGLPFVFACWCARKDRTDLEVLGAILNEARDRGVSQAAAIARARAAAAGWPTELAVRYLTHHLMYRLTDEARAGLARFLELAGELGWLDRKHEVAS